MQMDLILQQAKAPRSTFLGAPAERNELFQKRPANRHTKQRVARYLQAMLDSTIEPACDPTAC